jgi:hypothetical protein
LRRLDGLLDADLAPTLPWKWILPSLSGTWPDVNTMLPVRTQPT